MRSTDKMFALLGIVVTALVFFMVAFVIADSFLFEEETLEIVFTKDIIGGLGVSQSEWYHTLEDMSPSEGLVQNEDGTVTMTLKQSQLEPWRVQFAIKFDEVREDYNEHGGRSLLNPNQEYTSVLFACDDNTSLVGVDKCFYKAEAICFCIQLLNGVEPDDLSVDFNLTNLSNGEVLAEGSNIAEILRGIT